MRGPSAVIPASKVKRLRGPSSAREGVGIFWCAVEIAGGGLGTSMATPVPSIRPVGGLNITTCQGASRVTE